MGHGGITSSLSKCTSDRSAANRGLTDDKVMFTRWASICYFFDNFASIVVISQIPRIILFDQTKFYSWISSIRIFILIEKYMKYLIWRTVYNVAEIYLFVYICLCYIYVCFQIYRTTRLIKKKLDLHRNNMICLKIVGTYLFTGD